METAAEKYQRMMQERMQAMKNILDETEYRFMNTTDVSGDEVFEIFKNAADISNGLINYINAEIQSIDERNYVVAVSYKLKSENDSKTIHLKSKLSHEIDVAQVSWELNQILKLEGYIGDKYFNDVSQDIDLSGIAFTNFIKEFNLFEAGIIWRGRSEFENSEGFEDFWIKYNDHHSKTLLDSALNPEQKQNTEENANNNIAIKREEMKAQYRLEDASKSQITKKPWWKFW